ncbi:MAG: usg protein [Pseudomonadota bacterium]
MTTRLTVPGEALSPDCTDLERQLAGYTLATAEITYRMPDALSLLQTYVWQDYDMAPRFPVLRKFLDFWARELDGPIHSVRLAHAQLIRPAEVRLVGTEITIH